VCECEGLTPFRSLSRILAILRVLYMMLAPLLPYCKDADVAFLSCIYLLRATRSPVSTVELIEFPCPVRTETVHLSRNVLYISRKSWKTHPNCSSPHFSVPTLRCAAASCPDPLRHPRHLRRPREIEISLCPMLPPHRSCLDLALASLLLPASSS